MTAPRPRVEGEAVAEIVAMEWDGLRPDEMMRHLALDLLDARAEVERLRGVMEGEIEWLDGEAMRSREQEEAEARLLGVSPSTAPMVHFFNRKDKLRAALALPTPAPEATNDG